MTAHLGHGADTPETPLEPDSGPELPALAIGAAGLTLVSAAGWLATSRGLLSRRWAGVLLVISLLGLVVALVSGVG